MPSPSASLWRWPIVLGVLTATGLLAALVSDSWGDPWSWVGLGVPVAVMAWFGLPRRKASASLPESPAATRSSP
ncbi:hypothetical protein DSM104443_01395 [Usitatibacter rugosus]|uniref:DUF4175 domain-containing protein n=1 Tax=Usitatibacter rugosus TaxID=2732067 RepID=A0A6M4GXW3_9PROT|nr:hypothetical protein [Usitatibacter rugosus]QJR10337.1 hypothetical protein DSM104443_01395 [Usitatibacter rugosus]